MRHRRRSNLACSNRCAPPHRTYIRMIACPSCLEHAYGYAHRTSARVVASSRSAVPYSILPRRRSQCSQSPCPGIAWRGSALQARASSRTDGVSHEPSTTDRAPLLRLWTLSARPTTEGSRRLSNGSHPRRGDRVTRLRLSDFRPDPYMYIASASLTYDACRPPRSCARGG